MFDVVIMLVILLNMLTMALEHYDQPDELTFILSLINQAFIAIFTLECVMKMTAMRIHYFKQPWNVFDFVVVVMSILGQSRGTFSITVAIRTQTVVIKR